MQGEVKTTAQAGQYQRGMVHLHTNPHLARKNCFKQSKGGEPKGLERGRGVGWALLCLDPHYKDDAD